MDDWREDKSFDFEAGNLKDILGVPTKHLKKISMTGFMEGNYLEVLRAVYEMVPEFLEHTKSISPVQVDFFNNNILKALKRERTDIRGFARLDRKIQLRIMKFYFEKMSADRTSNVYRLFEYGVSFGSKSSASRIYAKECQRSS